MPRCELHPRHLRILARVRRAPVWVGWFRWSFADAQALRLLHEFGLVCLTFEWSGLITRVRITRLGINLLAKNLQGDLVVLMPAGEP